MFFFYHLTLWLATNQFSSIAGSETTATALSCITYYLQKNQEILKKLRQELQRNFNSCQEIDNASTSGLPYLNAIILEGMRIYPPLPFPLPRVVPEGGDTVNGHFIPAGVSIHLTHPSLASKTRECGASFANILASDHRLDQPVRSFYVTEQFQEPLGL